MLQENQKRDSLPENNDQIQMSEQSNPLIQSKSENKLSKDHRNYKLILIIVFLTIILVVISGGIFAYINLQNESDASNLDSNAKISSNKEPISSASATIMLSDEVLEPPVLYPEVEWQEVSLEEDPSLGRGALNSSSNEFKWGSIDLNGQSWVTSAVVQDNESIFDYLDKIEDYFQSKLMEQGWESRYKDDLYEFSPLAADGPGASIHGYLKEIDGMLRVIVLMEQTPIESFGGVPKCPCEVGYEIFISNPEEMSELVKRIK